jgi:hypothetical protein
VPPPHWTGLRQDCVGASCVVLLVRYQSQNKVKHFTLFRLGHVCVLQWCGAALGAQCMVGFVSSRVLCTHVQSETCCQGGLMCRLLTALPFQEYIFQGVPMLPHRVTHAHIQALVDTLVVGVCVLLLWNAEGFCLGIGTSTWSLRQHPPMCLAAQPVQRYFVLNSNRILRGEGALFCIGLDHHLLRCVCHRFPL